MAGTGVRAPGLGRLRANLARFAAAAEHPEAAETASAALIARLAASRAPRRTGRLASTVSAHGATVEVSAPYAGPIHSGWPAHGITARPFVTQAAEESEAAIGEFYRANLQQLADSIVGGTY